MLRPPTALEIRNRHGIPRPPKGMCRLRLRKGDVRGTDKQYYDFFSQPIRFPKPKNEAAGSLGDGQIRKIFGMSFASIVVVGRFMRFRVLTDIFRARGLLLRPYQRWHQGFQHACRHFWERRHSGGLSEDPPVRRCKSYCVRNVASASEACNRYRRSRTDDFLCWIAAPTSHTKMHCCFKMNRVGK